MLAAGGAVAGAAWVAPQITSVAAAAAASAGPGNVVTVGNSGVVLSSADGTEWGTAAGAPVGGDGAQTSAAGVSENLLGVAFSPPLGLFAAVGASGRVLTSPDGATWTVRFAPTESTLRAITWVDFCSRFIAVGDNGNMVFSTNGLSWIFSSTEAVDSLHAVAANDTTVVAVGANGTVVTSTDGSFFGIRGPVQGAEFTGIVWAQDGDDSQFVAVGSGGGAWSSPDGEAWTMIDTLSELPYTGVAFAANIGYVIVADDVIGGANYDGTTWTEGEFFPSDLLSITWSSLLGVFVATGRSGVVATSPDGVDWLYVEPDPTEVDLNGVAARVMPP
jgi:hypothetical protein